MQNSTRTMNGAYLQTSQFLNTPFIVKQNSTLNQKFNVNANAEVADSDRVAIRYIGLGNGGHRVITGINNMPKLVHRIHKPTDCALFNHIPFVLRLPQNDLTAGERIKYRMRTLVTFHGTTYVAYYLKAIDFSTTVPQIELRTVNNGVTVSNAYVPSIADLNPVPVEVNPGDVLTTTGDYINVTAKVPFVLTPTEVDEIVNACNIIYGDTGYGMISELALCSGVDRTVTGNFNGNTSSYTDAIAVQVASFLYMNFSAEFANDGIDYMLDIGSLESLLVVNNN